MERFEIHDNQFIKKNVISSLPELPEIIKTLLDKWSSNQIGRSGKYEETVDGHSKEPCGIAEHYLCQYYCNVITPEENNYDYADLMVGFLNVGDVLYALTIADIIVRVARKARKIAQSNDDLKSLDEFISNLDDLKYKIEHDNELNQNVKRDDQLDEKLKNQHNKARNAINKELIYKIDGATALAKEIGDDKFIQYAVDQCYFFEPKIVERRMKIIVGHFSATDGNNHPRPKELYARRSIKKSASASDETDEQENNNQAKTGTYSQCVDYVRTAYAPLQEIADNLDENVKIANKATEVARKATEVAKTEAKDAFIQAKKSTTIAIHDADVAANKAINAAKEAVKTANKTAIMSAKSEAEEAKRAAEEAKNAAEEAKKAAQDAKNYSKKKEDCFKRLECLNTAMKDIIEALDKINNTVNAVKEAAEKVYIKNVHEVNESSGDKSNESKIDTKYYLFNSSETGFIIKDFPIIIDTDGNEKLRSIINVDYTGYTIGAGKENIFQNYRISHIWGRAYDPRYFTNLWNVVLVPSWANDLLDKPNPVKGSLESRLKSTIMRICEVLYFREGENVITEDDWMAISIKCPEVINNHDIVYPKEHSYYVNIIKGKEDKTVGDIVKLRVEI